MSCTRQFLNLRWEHHTWRRRVTGSELLTGIETNMWAREVERTYVRCDKAEVCEVCGTIRHQVSCVCDIERGERCALRLESMAEAPAPAAPAV